MFPTHLTAFRDTPCDKITMQKYNHYLVDLMPDTGVMPVLGVTREE